MPMAEYRLSPAAERELEGIWTYTAQQWGAKQADQYIDILTTTFSDLAKHPKKLRPVTTSVRATAGAAYDLPAHHYVWDFNHSHPA